MKLDFEDGTLRAIGGEQIERARSLARASNRRRAILRYHEHHERIQRMINAVEPDSYVRPHRHASPAKTEAFIALSGSAILCTFDDSGDLREQLHFGADLPVRGVEVPPGTWHSLVSLENDTTLYEIIDGPFEAATHKEFASWAPAEDDAGAPAYWSELRARLRIDLGD